MVEGNLDHVVVHSDDIFETTSNDIVEITSNDTFAVTLPDWLGDVFSNRYTLSTTVVNRFNPTSLRYKTVFIYNFHATQNGMIGQYNAAIGTFAPNAIVLSPGDSIKLGYVDLYELAHLAPGSALSLNLLALNEY